MSVILQYDSDKNTHQVWAQEQASSCAVAAIWMARNQAFQKTVNQGEWALAWQIYGQVVQHLDLVPAPPAPRCLNPASYPGDRDTFEDMFASIGTSMGQVAQALANDGVRLKLITPFSPGTILNKRLLSDTSPAIILLGWYSWSHWFPTRNGGHFIVASRVASSGEVVYLDPWQGQLRELGPGPAYPGGGQFEQIVYISAS